MTRTAKIVTAATGILVFLIVFTLLNNPFAQLSASDYTIKNGHVTGTLTASSFEIILDAEITADEKAQVSVGRGRRIEYISNRTEILENIFGSIEGIAGIHGMEHDEYPINSLANLEEYVQMRMDNKMDENYDITPEDLAYFEEYQIGSFPHQKGSKIFSIRHRENEYYYSEIIESSPQEQMEMAEKFARDLLLDTSYFNFTDPIVSEIYGHIFPVQIDGLPIAVVSFDLYYDKNKELYMLLYQNRFPGIRINCNTSGEGITATIIFSETAVLPYEISTEKRPVISVAEAIEALKDNLDNVYIDDKLPRILIHPEEDLVITEISLAYAAVYDDNGEYDLEPVYTFTPDFSTVAIPFEQCFLVNAITSEVYPVIQAEHAWSLDSE